MNATTSKLDVLIANKKQALLSGGLKGIEKESLRLNAATGFIAQTEHPKSLGSALTHPFITTDYSEALIELITPPFEKIEATFNYLQAVHQFVYDNLEDEILLNASMPCGIDGDDSIPIAYYGTSNVGKMKHIYRHGLWRRYGRTMQAIAGIHFNYSLPENLLIELHKQENSSLNLEQFTSATYFALIRNFQRVGWIILYLFGASPAICKNFFKSRPALMAQFEEFDNGTLYHPYATSLRMSDIGYKSKNQAALAIDYNSVEAYVESLSAAINTPFEEYEKIGVVVDGQYKQLNSNLLQIENEFYSIIRPKQIAQSCEKPTLALKRRGVRYVEMRSLDLNIFEPLGLSIDTARFIETLLLSCALQASPDISAQEHKVNNSNQLIVANYGRKPDLQLMKNGQRISLKDWADEILNTMQSVAEILDNGDTNKPYSNALIKQRAVVNNPDLTPSAQLLAMMKARQQPFAKVALNLSRQHAEEFHSCQLDAINKDLFEQAAQESHLKQQEIESREQAPFDGFLQCYFNQQ